MQQSPTIAFEALPSLCSPLQGGFYGGLFRIDDKLYANIVAGAEGDLTGIWNKSAVAVAGTSSYADGLANTDAMAAAGSELAKAARALRIGGHDDWHIGARDVVELTYRHFKPCQHAENMWRAGDNPSSVPPGYPYTEQSPLQTACAQFQEGGADALTTTDWHWTSTQGAAVAGYAWIQDFSNGSQYFDRKSVEYRARPVRRVLVIQ